MTPQVSRRARWLCAVPLALALGLGGWASRPDTLRCRRGADTGRVSPIRFTDVTAASGVRFTHRHGGSGRHYYVETMGGGGAFLDYDGDGWLDIFLAQGAPLPGCKEPGPFRCALYRNRHDGTFVDVTREAGLGRTLYVLGPAVGDYNNDGRPDLYLTALGGNRLLRNEGARFRDVTAAAGVRCRDLSTGAAWLDYDLDGRLDLWVCRYMDYALDRNPPCRNEHGDLAYCTPHVYQGTHCTLYHSRGDGTFREVTQQSGIRNAIGRSLGIACADFDENGRVDVFVANDLSPNFLFLNHGAGGFSEEAALAGVSHGEHGVALAGMGTDVGDYDNDGRLDLVVTNFANEPTSLYRGRGDGTFSNESLRSGVGGASLPYLKWGCRFVDLDRDGWQDLFMANGHVDDHADERAGELGYAQPCQVLRNDGGASGSPTFADVSAGCGQFFRRRQVARGAAFGDYDNDGDADVLIACNNQPAILLRNDTPTRRSWIRLSLTGRGCNRDALGARVRLNQDTQATAARPMTQTQVVRSSCSYLSDHDRRLHFGVAPGVPAQVEVRWPCGADQRLDMLPGTAVSVTEQACRRHAARGTRIGGGS